MPAADRARSAVMFALTVAAAQAACLLVIWMLSLLPVVDPTRRRAGTGPVIQLLMFGLLLASPVFMHDGPVSARAGAVVGSFTALTLLNLLASGA